MCNQSKDEGNGYTSKESNLLKNYSASLCQQQTTPEGKNLLMRSEFFLFRVDPFLDGAQCIEKRTEKR